MSLGHSRAFCAWTPPRASWSIPGISTSSVKLLGIPQDDQIRPWDIPRRSDTPGRALGICWGARARGCHTHPLALLLLPKDAHAVVPHDKQREQTRQHKRRPKRPTLGSRNARTPSAKVELFLRLQRQHPRQQTDKAPRRILGRPRVRRPTNLNPKPY